MEANRTFRAGQAGLITGIEPNLQRNWRNRGILPPGTGEKVEFSIRDICQLRILRAISEAGVSLTEAAPAVFSTASRFVDVTQSALLAAYNEDGGEFSPILAVIVRDGSKVIDSFAAFDLAELCVIQKRTKGQQTTFPFTSILVVNLTDLARDMAKNIRNLDEALTDRQKVAKQRIEALESRNPGLKG